MRSSIKLLAAALAAVSAPAVLDVRVGGDEALASTPTGGAKASQRKTSVKRERWQDGRPRFGDLPPYSASFATALSDRPYAKGPFVRNPLISSEYRATAEYEYLYTASSAERSAPPPSNYRYAADNSYLLRPGLGRSAVALAYRWRYCMNTGLTDAPPASTVRLNAAAALGGRGRADKIESVLTPLILAGAGGPRLQPAQALSAASWGSAETHRPCINSR